MNKISELLLTSLLGVLVFVLTSFMLELIIKPLIKYRNTKIEIKGLIKYYKDKISNPLKYDGGAINSSNYVRYQETSQQIRKLACDLETSYYLNLKIFRFRPLIKESKMDITEAYSQLIGLSNNLIQVNINHDNDKYIQNLEKKLNIKIYE